MISLTPLIDVVFILLVFFMLASSFLDWRTIELKLPAKSNTAAATEPIHIVTIEESGALKLNGGDVAEDDFVAHLRQELSDHPEQPVLIFAPEFVPLQRSVEILEKITAAGGRNVSLSSGRREAP